MPPVPGGLMPRQRARFEHDRPGERGSGTALRLPFLRVLEGLLKDRFQPVAGQIRNGPTLRLGEVADGQVSRGGNFERSAPM